MKKNQNSFERLKWALGPLSAISFFMACIIQFSGLLPIYLMPKVIDEYIPYGNLQAILLSVLVFCGVPLFSSMFFNYYQYFLMKRGRQLSSRLTLDCFEKLIYQPVKFFDASYSAEVAKKCSQEANSYVSVWSIDVPKLVSNIIAGFVVFYLLFRIHPLLAAIQLFYFPVVLIILKLVGKTLERLVAKVLELNAKMQKYIQEAFHTIRNIKSYGLEPYAVKRVSLIQGETLQLWGKTAFFDNLVGGVSTTFIPGIFYGGTFILAAVLVMNGKITLGLLTATLGYATRIHLMFSELMRTYNAYKKAKGECEAILSYLNMEDERDDSAEHPWCFQEKICFEGVYFSYPGSDRKILENKSLTFPKGKWIGVSGASGVGKSTILELLLRFYDPDEGDITIDGNPIQQMKLAELRRNIAYITQEPFLIDGTIEENLRLVCEKNQEAGVFQVAELTGIMTHIEAGLQKRVGEAGMLLSGGEKQRIAIARCILRDCPLILLDEVTSQLDALSQNEMAEIFKELCQKKDVTIISVAHRAEFNRYADICYVLE